MQNPMKPWNSSHGTVTDELYSSAVTSAAVISAETSNSRAVFTELFRLSVPVIVLLGTVGNVLSFAVLLRQSMRSTPMYFYLMLLAVVDTLVLYTSAFKTWIRLMTGWEALHVSDFGCKLLTFVLLNALYLSAWLIVLVTLDRFLGVWFPFRVHLLMRIRQARIIAITLVILVAVYNVHVFWTFGLSERPGDDGSLKLKCQGIDDHFANVVFEYLKLISYCVVPFAIVTTLNIGIVIKIKQAYASNRSLSPSATGKRRPAPEQLMNNGRQLCDSALPSAPPSPPPPAPPPSATDCSNGGSRSNHHELMVLTCSRILAEEKRRRLAPYNYTYRYPRYHAQDWYQRQDRRKGSVANGSQQSTSTINQRFQTSINSACITQNHFDVQRRRQRRLTRMLLIVSFTWLLTAPFTVVSVLLPSNSASSSSSSASNSSIVQDQQATGTTNSELGPYNYSFVDNNSFQLSSSEIIARERYVGSVAMSTHSDNNPSPLWSKTLDDIETSAAFSLTTAAALTVVTATGDSRKSSAVSGWTRYEFAIKTICFLLVYVNHAANFYLYCLTGKKFRHELCALCRSCCWRRRHRNARPNPVNNLAVVGDINPGVRTAAAAHAAANSEAGDTAAVRNQGAAEPVSPAAAVSSASDKGTRTASSGSSENSNGSGNRRLCRDTQLGRSCGLPKSHTVLINMTPLKKGSRPHRDQLYS